MPLHGLWRRARARADLGGAPRSLRRERGRTLAAGGCAC